MAIVNVLGRDYRMHIDPTYDTAPSEFSLDCEGDATLSATSSSIETSCKSSNGAITKIPDTKSYSVSGGGSLMRNTDTGDMSATVLLNLLKNQTKVQLRLSTGVLGDDEYVMVGYFPSVEVSYPLEGVSSYTYEFDVDGEITIQKVTA